MIKLVCPHALLARRVLFLAANLLTYFALLVMLAYAIGWNWLSPVLLVCFAMFLPWSVLGFWNGIIGLVLLLRDRRVALARPDAPVILRTAILMTVRNEDPERAVARLRIVQGSIEATGQEAQFSYFLLSDTSRPQIAAREEAAMAAWQAEAAAPERVHYRRRVANTGFKAGNIMAFCDELGSEFALMVTLDADSLMSAAAVLELVQTMQENPQFGIVQGLVTGMPSTSAFARLFQFGMRHGMRSYTVGQAWWTGDCGPYWGHNAIIRVAPFRDHCKLPRLPGRPPFGGDILSHDQVEATLMRRAGYEVRLQPVAGGSWEENPPTLLDYVRRDLRWCQGNLQYIRLLGLPGLRPVSRFQLMWAILMFICLPAGTLMMALLPAAAGLHGVRLSWLAAVYWLYLLMHLTPKLAGYLHTAMSRRRRMRWGGGLRFASGVACELVFSLLQFSITSIHTSLFIAAMPFGRSMRWSGQAREARAVSWREAAWMFWPQTVFGVVLHLALLWIAPGLLPWVLPFTLGNLTAIPFTVLTAHPGFGRWCVATGLCAVPEERVVPPELRALAGTAIAGGT
jgi:membrane glycosyltransferase